MQLIEGTALSNMCDYSFGDHLGGLAPNDFPGGFMKQANEGNIEFLDKCKEFEGGVMSLFIDNIRLYNRPVATNPGPDTEWVNWLQSHNDLLALCSKLLKNKFVIFTSHEDTPLDEYLKIPDNVVGIHAVNGLSNNPKVYPFPLGLQRPIGRHDNRLSVMQEVVEKDEYIFPRNLLYINCGLGSERNQTERAYLPTFQRFEWATCRFDPNSKFFSYDNYIEFLTELRNHKFVVCPKGHGMDCHRNWETLYMRRVPIFKEDPYFRKLMAGFPALFVNDWSDITPALLVDNDFLYQKVQKMKMKTLDLSTIYSGIISSYMI